MTSRLDAVRVYADDPRRMAEFWGELVGRVVDEAGTDAEIDLLPGKDVDLRLRFVVAEQPKPGLNGMHLHLTSASPEDQDETVRRAIALGARHLDVGQTPEDEHVVLADPEGNEFCVIEPGNSFLAG